MPEAPRAKSADAKVGLEATIIAHDPRMVEIVRLLERLATASSNVVLSGESGTGKDLAAHALHLWGERSALPMVTVDLPSIPQSLLESELFGYERGAFTGATQRKAGKFELAGKGTLFLDQIGELSPLHQAKLLRAVEERRFERLGGTEPVELEARLIASASADLEQAVTRELFRGATCSIVSVFSGFGFHLFGSGSTTSFLSRSSSLKKKSRAAAGRRVDFPQMRYRSSRLMRGRETYGSSRASSSTG